MKTFIQKLTFQHKIIIYFTLAILVLSFIFYAITVNNRYSIKTGQSVEHAQQVLFQTEELRNQIDEIQSGIRGYIITGNDKYLNDYKDSASLHNTILQLKKLTDDHPDQQTAIDSMESVVKGLVKWRQQLRNVRSENSFIPVQITGIDESETLTQNARSVIMKLQQEENGLLTRSKAENMHSIRNSSIIISFFTIIIIILLVAAFLVILKNSRLRNKAEQKINTINASLAQAVEEKTREIIQKEMQYRFLIENMNQGIQLIGFDWRYLFLNNSAAQQSRFSKQQLLGHTLMEKYPGIENSDVFHTFQTCMNERLPRTIENEYVYPDGSKQWFELSIQPVREGLFILSTDVTERKKAQHELAEQRLHQQKLITEITIQAQEKEKNELAKELHDNINQILATAKLYVDMAQNNKEGKQELLVQSSDYITRAIQEIRTLSHSLVAPSLGDTTLHDVLKKLTYEANLVNGLNVEFNDQRNFENKLDKGKELMLYRVAQEQISNIRKYSKAKQASLLLVSSGHNVVLSISDNGIGFDTTRRSDGMGIKNIKSRVEFYSGKMNLQSSPGKGCALEIIVPA